MQFHGKNIKKNVIIAIFSVKMQIFYFWSLQSSQNIFFSIFSELCALCTYYLLLCFSTFVKFLLEWNKISKAHIILSSPLQIPLRYFSYITRKTKMKYMIFKMNCYLFQIFHYLVFRCLKENFLVGFNWFSARWTFRMFFFITQFHTTRFTQRSMPTWQ